MKVRIVEEDKIKQLSAKLWVNRIGSNAIAVVDNDHWSPPIRVDDWVEIDGDHYVVTGIECAGSNPTEFGLLVRSLRGTEDED